MGALWRKLACVLAAAISLTLATADSSTTADEPLVVDVPTMLSIDPAFAYLPGTRELLTATCLKLVNYPDAAGAKGKRPVPEASKYPVVSGNRLTWTFHVKTGLRFSNGTAVDAKDFAWDLDRDIFDHSAGAPFLSNVEGYQEVWDHNQQAASGITVSGDALVIKLKHPDNGLPLQLATNYFCALPEGTPYAQITTPVPSAGPYLVQSYIPGHEAVLVKNPLYEGTRQAHLSSIVLQQANQAQATQDAKNGTVDLVLDNDLLDTALKGLNSAATLKVRPTLETDYIALNTSRPLFRPAAMRQAFNNALDRPAMLRVRGIFAGQRTDQILPPGMAGFRDAKTYPINGPNLGKASALAAPRCSRKHRCHGVFLTCNVGDCISIGKVVKKDLARIGVDLKVEAVDGQTFFNREHRKGEPFDAVIASWSAGYADPFDFIDPLVNGHTLHSPSNVNFSFLNNPAVNKALAADKKLLGPARYKAYGSLDIDITAKVAPWASYDNANEREFVAKRVKGYVFQPALDVVPFGTIYLGN